MQTLQSWRTEHSEDIVRFADKRMTVGYVIVKRLDVDDEKTEGGIVKPEIARTRSQRGIVVAAAKDMLLANQLLPLDIHPGDEVLFTKYGGSDIEIDGQKYVLVHHLQIYFAETPIVANHQS